MSEYGSPEGISTEGGVLPGAPTVVDVVFIEATFSSSGEWRETMFSLGSRIHVSCSFSGSRLEKVQMPSCLQKYTVSLERDACLPLKLGVPNVVLVRLEVPVDLIIVAAPGSAGEVFERAAVPIDGILMCSACFL